MVTVAITGASGFIGTALVRTLVAGGHDVVRFVRREAASAGEATWDPAAGSIDSKALARAGAVVHLAGEPLGERRWTRAQKARILESRIQATSTLTRALAALDPASRPGVLVSGSAIGFYGLRGDEELTERSTPGTGFLADVVKQWEAAARPAEDAGIRVVYARTGIVLGRSGALGRMLPIFKLGLGGRLGSGKQWWSWISLEDTTGLLRHAIVNESVAGAMNLTSPHPARFADIAKALGRVLHRPAVLPVPALALRIVLGRELADEVALAGQRALPDVALRSGYAYQHTDLEDALRAAVAE